MDLSIKGSGYNKSDEDADRYHSEKQLDAGRPIFIEVDEILSDSSIRGSLVLAAFGVNADTKIHIHQAPGTRHFDSLPKHIAGNEYTSALRKGDIVGFDRVFVENGDCFARRITSRTHDGMKGEVQFAVVNGRLGPSTVGSFGALQTFTTCDGSNAYRIENIDHFKLAYEHTAKRNWLGTAGGILRLPNGQTRQYTIDNETPLQAVIEEIEFQELLSDSDDWFEYIPSWNIPASRDQIARDVNLKENAKRKLGHISSSFATPKNGYSGFQPCGVIFCNEDEFKFGGKTGKVIRVAAGVQRLSHTAAVDMRSLPSRVRTEFGPVTGVSHLFSDATLEEQMKERSSRQSKDNPDAVSPGNPSDVNSTAPVAMKKFW